MHAVIQSRGESQIRALFGGQMKNNNSVPTEKLLSLLLLELNALQQLRKHPMLRKNMF